MTNPSPYATNKLSAHPEILKDMRAGGQGRLLQVHLMPQNLCNQSCSFCSYRMDGNKNSEEFDAKSYLSADDIDYLAEAWYEMGVNAIEVTGGGEPLAHPHVKSMFTALSSRRFDIGLVTNGTLLHKYYTIVPRLKWLRISIDAATKEVYCRMRKTTERHFAMAWAAVSASRTLAPYDPEFRLGVGFVLSNENWTEILPFVQMAKEAGADNVRLSSTFSDGHLSYFNDDVDLEVASRSSEQAKEMYEDDTFKVHNLIPKRLWETQHHEQDYVECRTKDLLCVVEGTGKVYTCCTFTGSNKGLYGNFKDHPGGFKGLWEEKAGWRKELRACDYCKVSCLYRDRNLDMNAMVAAPEGMLPKNPDIIHKNFI